MNRKLPFTLLLVPLLTSLFVFLGSVAGLSTPPSDAPSQPLALLEPCPLATQELPPAVEPVISPTNLSAQTIQVSFPAEWIMVIHELGAFKIPCDTGPCHHIPILLKPNTVNHLTVVGKVRTTIQFGDCVYGGYIMSVQTDREGNPLEITQVGGKIFSLNLPLLGK